MARDDMIDEKRFLRASLSYSVSQVLCFAASLVSFPVLTRILTLSEYGVLALCNTTLLFGCAVAKFGLQNSIVRYYSQYRKSQELDTFYSTFWYGGVAVAVVVSVALMPVFLVLAPATFEGTFLSVALLIFGMSAFSIVSNFLRGAERNDANALLNVIFRYAGTFGGIALIAFCSAGLSALFLAQFAVLALLTGSVLVKYRKRHRISRKYFSLVLLRDGFSYGVPLIAFELSSIVLAFSDRYLINYYCGAEQLGIYTAGYTICFYLADIVRQPLQLSVMPIYLRIHADEGLERTTLFLREALAYLFMAIAPIFAGFVALKSELLLLLASSRYDGAARVVPWVLGGTLLYACQPLLAAGFYINKQTRAFSLIVAAGASVNILLNVLLIPRYGMVAAAWSTAVSYGCLLGVMAMASNKIIPLSVPWGRIAFYCLNAAVMYLTIVRLTSVSLPARLLSGIVQYSAALLLFDRKLSGALLSLVQYRQKQSEPAK